MSFFGPNAVLDDQRVHVYDYNENRSDLESERSGNPPSYHPQNYTNQRPMPSGVPLQPLADMWKSTGPVTPHEFEQRLQAQPLMWIPSVPSHPGPNTPFSPMMPPFGMPFGVPPNLGTSFVVSPQSLPPQGMPPNGGVQMPPIPTMYGMSVVPPQMWSDKNPQGSVPQNPWSGSQQSLTSHHITVPQSSDDQKSQDLTTKSIVLTSSSDQQPQEPIANSGASSSPENLNYQHLQDQQDEKGAVEYSLSNTNDKFSSKQDHKPTTSRSNLSNSVLRSNHSRQKNATRAVNDVSVQSAAQLSESKKDPYSFIPKSNVTVKSITEARENPRKSVVAKNVQQNSRFTKSEDYFAESELLRPNRRYRHLMTDNDKRYIMENCLKSIANDDPFIDDFYFHVYSTIHGREVNSREASKYFKFYQKGEGHASEKMKMQVQRAIERAQENRQRRKDSSKYIQQCGSRLRQALPALFETSSGLSKAENSSSHSAPSNILSNTLSDDSGAPTSLVSVESVLKGIEHLYDDIMAIEAHAQRRPKPTDPSASEWASQGQPMQEKLWLSFYVQKPEDKNKKQPFIEMIKVPKGMKVFARSWSQLDPTKRLTVLTRCVVNISDLQIPPSKFELFSQAVIQPLVHLINDADLSTVILMVDLARSKSTELVESRVGQLLLTAIISRGEMLNQDGTTQSEDLKQWQDAFSLLFDDILPVLRSLDIKEDSTWHFLAALALGSDLNKQSDIVDLVRKQIFAQHNAAKIADNEVAQRKIAALNLFLNVLGLNATLEEITEL